MIAKNREVTVIAKMPSGDERGIKLKSDPTIVSPNNPPIPKLCAHAFIGTMDAAYTEDNAIAMGTNISLPLQEDVLPVAQIFMMLLISWAGTCKNPEGVWESKCQTQKNNI